MTMPKAMPLAMLQASSKQSDKQCQNGARLAMHGRTDGRTNGEVTHVSHQPSLTDTCARVQDYDDSADLSRTLRAGRLAAHKGEDAEVGK